MLNRVITTKNKIVDFVTAKQRLNSLNKMRGDAKKVDEFYGKIRSRNQELLDAYSQRRQQWRF